MFITINYFLVAVVRNNAREAEFIGESMAAEAGQAEGAIRKQSKQAVVLGYKVSEPTHCSPSSNKAPPRKGPTSFPNGLKIC